MQIPVVKFGVALRKELNILIRRSKKFFLRNTIPILFPFSTALLMLMQCMLTEKIISGFPDSIVLFTDAILLRVNQHRFDSKKLFREACLKLVSPMKLLK